MGKFKKINRLAFSMHLKGIRLEKNNPLPPLDVYFIDFWVKYIFNKKFRKSILELIER